MVNEVVKSIKELIEANNPTVIVSNEMIPIDDFRRGAVYVVLSVDQRSRTAISKTCNDYNVSVDINIFQSQRKGFFSNVLSSDLEQSVEILMKGIQFGGGIKRKSIIFNGSNYSRVETATKTASKITMNYDLWLTGN